jgi:hypothetical protein
MLRNYLPHCLIGVGAALVVLLAFGVQANTLLFLAAALACPLMMVFMMRGMMGGQDHTNCDHPDHHHGATTEPPDRTKIR